MARRFRRRPQLRTKTITKTRYRTRFASLRRARSRVSSLSGFKGHSVAITSGLGAGTIANLATNTMVGQQKPNWLSPLVGFVSGLLVGKSVQKSWSKAIEAGLAGAGGAYLQDRIATGQPIIPSFQQQTGILPSLQVY